MPQCDSVGLWLIAGPNLLRAEFDELAEDRKVLKQIPTIHSCLAYRSVGGIFSRRPLLRLQHSTGYDLELGSHEP